MNKAYICFLFFLLCFKYSNSIDCNSDDATDTENCPNYTPVDNYHKCQKVTEDKEGSTITKCKDVQIPCNSDDATDTEHCGEYSVDTNYECKKVTEDKEGSQITKCKSVQKASNQPTQESTQGATTGPTQGTSNESTQGATTGPTQGASVEPNGDYRINLKLSFVIFIICLLL